MEPVFARGDFKATRKLEKLLAQAKQDRVPKVMLRMQGLLLSLEGKTTGAIAQTLRVHRSTVPLWIQNWNDHGVASLPAGHRCGRPAGLSRGQQASLADLINSGPVAAGFDTGIWTSPLIAQVIAEEFSPKPIIPGMSANCLSKWDIPSNVPLPVWCKRIWRNTGNGFATLIRI